jgi:N-acetylglucosamine kinase-like BadF-type ATPase
VAYYLGIDGGGSKTTCAVGDERSLLATATAGPSNITRVGELRAREALHHAIREACAAAGIAPRQVVRVCIGVAGAGREEIAGVVRKITAEIFPGEIKVVGDMEIAMEAAFGAGPGVIIIAGTGSIAYGRNAQGKTARAGGWGFSVSDEGSAHWIGRAAVSSLLRALDETHDQEQAKNDQAAAEALPLFHELRAAWNLHSLDEFARTANSNPDFAALFPVILSVAESGDNVARSVLTQAGRELARLAGIVARRLFAENETSAAVPLAVVGGVFRHSQHVREVFCDGVRQLDPRIVVNGQVVDPIAGALQIARKGSRVS